NWGIANVRFGSRTDILRASAHVCFTPESGHQFGFDGEDSRTLYATIGRRMPFSSNSPTGSTVTAFSMAWRTRGLMRIWPGLASSQRREATFETVPMAA